VFAGRDPWAPVLSGLRFIADTSRGPTAVTLRKIYAARSYRPFWVTPLALNEGGRSLMAQIAGPGREDFGGDEHRLNELAHLYRLAFPAPLQSNPHAIADLEWALSMCFVKYATILTEGKAPWVRAEEDWHLRGERSDPEGMFRQVESLGASRALDRMLLSHESYTSLTEALAEYRAIARAGGWPAIEGGGTLELGNESPRVRRLRRRLLVTRDLETEEDSPLFDEAVQRAVLRFQARHGLPEDGRMGPKTLEALNVSVESRIRQLEVNLERRRWLPPKLEDEILWINVPEFRLRVFRGEQEVLSMPVVVGAPSTPTPSFNERLSQAVLNPYWYVPESIAVKELVPKADENPNYLRNANFDLLDDRGELMSFESLSPDLLRSGRLRLRRKPGPFNDLGRIKFLFPNPFNVYLHDTPSRQLFERPSRAFSHGCIRVGEPLELAKYLFGDRFSELERDLTTGEEKVLKVADPVPVYIVYFTAWRSADGTVNFRDDIYARDEAVLRGLTGARGTMARAVASTRYPSPSREAN
jgi:murein L,D-transpeptidase YcbB/YkuD